jgi:hypothetical protein
MFTTVRAIIAIASGLLFALGLLLITVGGPAAPAGIWPLIAGGVGVIAVVLERQRYRSEAAERDREPIGPGGGEPAPLPPQFRSTDERFVDPTTGRVMRVFVDDRTGERRYRADA